MLILKLFTTGYVSIFTIINFHDHLLVVNVLVLYYLLLWRCVIKTLQHFYIGNQTIPFNLLHLYDIAALYWNSELKIIKNLK